MSGSGSGASSLTRRSFLGHGAALGAAAALPGILPAAGRAPLCVGGSDELKIGVIGCGGRGSGAVVNCIESSPGVRLHAIGELFSDRMESARKNLGKRGELFQVPDDRAFVGFDAVDKVLATDVDLVILATPPAFRPEHLAKAIAAGKHVFMEKPVAVCPAGIRSVIASAKLAKDKGLGIVAGTQRRHQESYLETIRRIQDGAIGEVIGGRCSWNMAGLWVKQRADLDKAAGRKLSELEWQMRNWLLLQLDQRRPHRRTARPQHRCRKLGQGRRTPLRLRRHGRTPGPERTKTTGKIFDHHMRSSTPTPTASPDVQPLPADQRLLRTA
jgi:myo-inositol 2-dehydrogenase/D-chiro-inositol 1-dehydrogenase